MMKKISLLLLLYSFLAYGTAQSDEGRYTVKLSPQVRIIEREHSIPTIPRGIIQQFLNRPQLITDEEIESAGYVIANANQSLLSTEGHKIYVSGLDEGAAQNRYIILRLGQTYRSPLEDDDGEALAYEAIYLGEAVLEIPGEPAALNIIKANREIRVSDRLLPKIDERTFYDDFYPHSPESLEETYIIAEANGTLIIGRYQVVIINKGLDDGIERGHLLAVNKNSRQIFDTISSQDEVVLQKQRAGTLLVFRVFDSVSYALVMSSRLPINVLDEVTVP
ncbi:MAG: hypothetical protein ABFS56_23285 [Pseudomonadota bacterium]